MKPSPSIIIIGPQGSGKGTQARKLTGGLGFYHFSVGDALRNIAKQPTKLGREVDEVINKKGGLVPFELVIETTAAVIEKIPASQGIIFDGTPRRLQEIEPFNALMKKAGRKITHVFFIDVPKAESIKRLSKRRICELNGEQINMIVDDVKALEDCKKKGGQVIYREDDKPAAIEKRLSWYEEQTKPVLDYFASQGQLIKINGDQSIEDVHKEIMRHL